MTDPSGDPTNDGTIPNEPAPIAELRCRHDRPASECMVCRANPADGEVCGIRGGTNRAHCGAFCTGGCPEGSDCAPFGHEAGPDQPMEPIGMETGEWVSEGVMAG